MKNSRLAAALILAALVAAKLLLPDAAAGARRKAAELLKLDGDASAAFAALGERLSLAPPDEAAAAEKTEAPEPAAEAARIRPLRYRVEEASASGEIPFTPPAEPGPPEAVAAFLESQSAFLDGRGLPDSVDYTYTELPFAYAVPVSGRNSSGFGYRVHPILDEVRFHYGTDFAANAGEDIRAFAAGTVTFAGPSDSFGNYIVIDHGDGWTSLYAHCSYLYAQAGQEVAAGEKIALVGATGLVTGPHLHFELCRDGVYLNPEYYING